MPTTGTGSPFAVILAKLRLKPTNKDVSKWFAKNEMLSKVERGGRNHD
jgi:hypothetical protein